ncbi:hypothetical protein LEP1GSC005_1808 [Leptospira santarosai str. ST188]|nr:hypothetical protein LEP1GSC005_1808 [Leptospira santarosai str. ST188]
MSKNCSEFSKSSDFYCEEIWKNSMGLRLSKFKQRFPRISI